MELSSSHSREQAEIAVGPINVRVGTIDANYQRLATGIYWINITADRSPGNEGLHDKLTPTTQVAAQLAADKNGEVTFLFSGQTITLAFKGTELETRKSKYSLITSSPIFQQDVARIMQVANAILVDEE